LHQELLAFEVDECWDYYFFHARVGIDFLVQLSTVGIFCRWFLNLKPERSW